MFIDGAGERRTIRLGKVSAKAAESFKLRVEALVEAQLLRQPLHADLAAWVADLPDVMHDRLVRVGLAMPRAKAAVVTLGNLLERFTTTATVKPATMAAYRQTTGSLVDHIGDHVPVTTITPADADDWRKVIADSGLAPATVSKRVRVARAIFHRAVRWGMVRNNPFADVRAGPQSNPDRAHYVPVATVAAIMDACPDAQWRAIIALVRFAGLRCPSEVVGLRWGDVDFDRARLTVRSPKTAGHDGHAVRVVPITPEVRPILQDLFDVAEVGVEAVVPRLRDASTNLRTHFERIIGRAGLKPWPRLFHNMRASCATDWVERFPAHVVAGWLGHSPMIAAKHYLQTRDAHFDLAARVTATPWQGGAKSGAPAAHNPAQHAAAMVRESSQGVPQPLAAGEVPRSIATDCKALTTRCETPENKGLGPAGFEHPQETRGKRTSKGRGGAESGALSGDSAPNATPANSPIDPDLASVIAAWGDLPAAVRAGIVALVGAARGPTGGAGSRDGCNGPQRPPAGLS